MSKAPVTPEGELCISCYSPATRLITLHEKLADGRIHDLEAWVCYDHHKVLSTGSITF